LEYFGVYPAAPYSNEQRHTVLSGHGLLPGMASMAQRRFGKLVWADHFPQAAPLVCAVSTSR